MHVKPAGFDEKLIDWLLGCQKIVNDHLERYPGQEELLELDPGTRYVRVWADRIGRLGAGKRIYAFIDSNGDVLKPATWKAPAKHARGNLFDEFGGLKHMSQYGPAYLR